MSLKATSNQQPGVFHHPRNEDRTHDHIVFHMASGAIVSFNDPRRFGYMKIVRRTEMEQEPFLKGLGPEPLGNEFDAAMLARACAGKKANLKAALLDQRVVAGLGNIYVCEALHRSHLSPKRAASTLAQRNLAPTDHAKRLVGAIHTVLNAAIEAGGSSLARSSAHRRRARLFPALVPGLRPREAEVPDAEMRRHHQALHARRAFDLLVPEVPEVTARPLAGLTNSTLMVRSVANGVRRNRAAR